MDWNMDNFCPNDFKSYKSLWVVQVLGRSRCTPQFECLIIRSVRETWYSSNAHAGLDSLLSMVALKLLLCRFGQTNARILKAPSCTLNEWKFILSFSRVSLLFLNSWRASVVPCYVTTHPPAIKKQH
jgi:hypothetical protein